jgi:hypothetical protein
MRIKKIEELLRALSPEQKDWALRTLLFDAFVNKETLKLRWDQEIDGGDFVESFCDVAHTMVQTTNQVISNTVACQGRYRCINAWKMVEDGTKLSRVAKDMGVNLASATAMVKAGELLHRTTI